MKALIITLIVSVSTAFTSFSQVCNVFVTPIDTTICPGDSVCISAVASITNGGQSFNFNFGALPPGWATSGGTNYGSPCGASPTGTPYFWASTAGTLTPQITTANFDISCGGVVEFDMKYSIQSNASPCEGPDEGDEGVELQYSLTGGAPWTPIIYYRPDGVELPANPGTPGSVVTAGQATIYTSWASYSVPIPAGALSTSTSFRWVQDQSSGADFDNWGLDNITINAGPCGSAIVDWDNGLQNTNAFCASPTVDTAFVALIYDTLGVLQCTSDTIFVNIYNNTLTYDLVDTVFTYCPFDSTTVEAVNFMNGMPPFDISWSTGSTTNPTSLFTGIEEQNTLLYYLDVTDGCGYVVPDSVVLINNQLLQIDTLLSFPSSACNPDGAVSAIVSGVTDVLGQPFYHWNGPGATNPNFIDATVWQDISPGWYFFTVTDDVCEISDSVFVDIENPPIAEISATPTSGCGPLAVTFSNTSQNCNEYYWDFGNGNVMTVNDLNNQSQTYDVSTTIMLVSFADPTCSDTAYISIVVTPCGCMDPIAINYDPNAISDDGSCVYPIPTAEVPNVFTPNGDGLNDLFEITTTNTVKLEVTVVNRWGNTMYSNESNPSLPGISAGWTGRTKGGSEANDGTYFYKYAATGVNGTIIEGHGFVQLIRE
jgi:gliding motility-associated-like protein